MQALRQVYLSVCRSGLPTMAATDSEEEWSSDDSSTNLSCEDQLNLLEIGDNNTLSRLSLRAPR